MISTLMSVGTIGKENFPLRKVKNKSWFAWIAELQTEVCSADSIVEEVTLLWAIQTELRTLE